MSIFTNPASGAAEQGAAYTRAVSELLGEREPLHVLRETPEAIGALVTRLTSEERRQPESPGKWSVNQVLRHLADSELVWGYRMRRVLAEDRPVLTGYDQDLWADRLGYADGDAAGVVDEFARFRAANLRLLERATPADLRRVGLHAERGEESLEHMTRLYAGHDLAHLRQLDRIGRKVHPGT